MNWKEVLGWSGEQTSELRYAGFSFLAQGQYDKAINFFEALTALEPNHPYDAQTLGALYLQTGKDIEALEHLNKALQLDPTHEPTQLNKVKALLGAGQTAEALSMAKQLVSSLDGSISNDAEALLMAYR